MLINRAKERGKAKGKGARDYHNRCVFGARALREHVLACLPGVIGLLLFYSLLSRFNATFLHRSLLPDQTFRNFPFSPSQERYLRIPEFLACS